MNLKHLFHLTVFLFFIIGSSSCSEESDDKKATNQITERSPVKLVTKLVEAPEKETPKEQINTEQATSKDQNKEAISEPEPTLADRKKWYDKLTWDKTCEQEFQNKQIVISQDYGGIHTYPLDTERLLVEILCYESDDAVWPWEYQIYFIHNTKTHQTTKVKLPGFKAENSEETLLEYTPVFGLSEFNKQTKTLSAMQEYRKDGACGLYAEYKFNKDNEVIVITAHERGCDELEEGSEESEFEAEKWPVVHLTDHSESEWRSYTDDGTDHLSEAGVMKDFNAVCTRLSNSENPAKKAQGYQCQAWAIMAKGWKQTATPEVLDLSAKAIALMPKDKSLYANRFKLVEDKDKAIQLGKALQALPDSVNVEYWLEQTESYNTSEDRHADILRYVQVLNKKFPNDYRIFNKLALFSSTDEERLKFYEESYKQYPDQPITMIKLAQLYNWDIDTEKVNKLFSEAITVGGYDLIEKELGLTPTFDYVKFLSRHMNDDATACVIMRERLGENSSLEGLTCP